MFLLALERSTRMGSVAAFKDGEFCAHRSFDDGAYIVAVVNALLAEIEATPAMITYCAVGLGPGSFAGIRSVLAFVQGFTASANIPIIGISSVAAMAITELKNREIFSHRGTEAQRDEKIIINTKSNPSTISSVPPCLCVKESSDFPSSIQKIGVIGDARRGHYWMAGYERQGNSLKETLPLRLIPYGQLSQFMMPDYCWISPDTDRISEVNLQPITPDARAVALLALDNDFPKVTPPHPVYLHHAV